METNFDIITYKQTNCPDLIQHIRKHFPEFRVTNYHYVGPYNRVTVVTDGPVDNDVRNKYLKLLIKLNVCHSSTAFIQAANTDIHLIARLHEQVLVEQKTKENTEK